MVRHSSSNGLSKQSIAVRHEQLVANGVGLNTRPERPCEASFRTPVVPHYVTFPITRNDAADSESDADNSSS